MADLQFILDGDSSIPPTEWQKLELQLAWDNDHPSSMLSTKQFTFEGKAAKRINTWISNGTTSGGKGIMEGVPFEINAGSNITALKGCVDIAAQEAVYRCDKVVVPVRDNRIKDYLDDRAGGFSFAFLTTLPSTNPARITQSDYVKIPYCISSIPDYSQLLSTGLAIFTIKNALEEGIKNLAIVTAGLIPPTTIWAAIAIVLQVAFLGLQILALIKLIQLFIDNIIQKKKYKKGMLIRTLYQKACSYIGLSFSSTILNNPASNYFRAAIMPRKIVQPTNGNYFIRPADESLSNTSYGYYDGTFLDLIHETELLFNARAVIKGSTLHFERKDHWNSQASIRLPDIDLYGVNNGQYRYNASELYSNIFCIYELDNNELNTYDDYYGTSCQMQAKPITIGNNRNLLLQGFMERRFPFALAKRKIKLTAIEKVMQDIINLIVGFPAFGSRIGWLLLSNDFTGTQKFVILDSTNKVHPNNANWTSAATMMQQFHSIDYPLNNQWMLYEGWEIPFCCDDYVALLNNNVIKTFDNRLGKVTKLNWEIGSDVAVIDFKVRPVGGKYTTNISQQLIANLR